METTAVDTNVVPETIVATVPTTVVEPTAAPVEPAAAVSVDVCQECGGKKWGRGYVHTATCSLRCGQAKNAEKRVCSVCGGPALGRGFVHTDWCTESTAAKLQAKKIENANKPKAEIPATCPECHGPRLGRGHQHFAGCSRRNPNAKTFATAPVAPAVVAEPAAQ